MLNTHFYTIIIDFSGEAILSDNQDIISILKSDYRTNLFNALKPESRDYLGESLDRTKKGIIVDLTEKSKLFVQGFNYQIVKLLPIYNNENSIVYFSVQLEKVEGIENQIFINEGKYENLFNLALDAIFVTDLEGNFLEVNQTAINRTGFKREQFLKLNIIETPIKSSNQTFANYFQELMVFGESTALINYIGTKGNIVETEISGKKFIYNGLDAVLHISREISVRNRQHAESLDSLVQYEEEERSNFAYEINDILGPNLSLVKMLIDSYLNTDDLNLKEKIIERIKIPIDKSIDDITLLSNRISPLILKNLGLRVALEVFVKKLQKVTTVLFNCNFELPDYISDNIAIVTYRAITELLKNINLHSNARNVRLNAEIINSKIQIDIEEDGTGFEMNKYEFSQFEKDILIVTNKIKSIRGTIDIIRVSGKGSHIIIEIPNYEKAKS